MTKYTDSQRETNFWARVLKTDSCWLWQAALTDGYGHLSVKGKPQPVHRYAHELLVGPIPSGLEIDHLCFVRNCVNPAHLEAVLPRINNLRSSSPAGVNSRKTTCPLGHQFDSANTRIQPDGGRRCRACDNLRHDAAYWRARRAKKTEERLTKPKPRIVSKCECGCGEQIEGTKRLRFVNQTHRVRVWRAKQKPHELAHAQTAGI